MNRVLLSLAKEPKIYSNFSAVAGVIPTSGAKESDFKFTQTSLSPQVDLSISCLVVLMTFHVFFPQVGSQSPCDLTQEVILHHF